MKICVLQCSYEGASSSATIGLEPDRCVAPLLPEHEVVLVGLRKATISLDISRLARQGYDLFINLCDGMMDEDLAGVETSIALARERCVFIGANPRFFEKSRLSQKMAAESVGVHFPAFAMVNSLEDMRWCDGLRFPLLVKHPQSYNSVGLERASRVTNRAELEAQVVKVISLHGAALVEEFIEGREFTVLVAEGADAGDPTISFPAVECVFPPGETFKTFDVKWKSFCGIEWHAVADAKLDEELRRVASRLFEAVGGDYYGRVDIRMGADGIPRVLEINAQCSIFYDEANKGSADHILALSPGGPSGFLRHLIHVAQRKWKAVVPRTETRWFTGDRGFAIVAAASFAAGETIEAREGEPVCVVSSGAMRRFEPVMRQTSGTYPRPLASHTVALASPDPEDWRPYGHSCNPNAWFKGLDIVARRDIAKGECITLDYATCATPLAEPLKCTCGTTLCRGIVTSVDFLAPWVDERYSGHTTPHVAEARLSAAR